MKTAAAFLLLISAFTTDPVFGQGGLTPPPGPPAPTMKSLDQVEPRIIVNATNTPGDGASTYIISLPGSYYLTSDLVGDPGKHGISIQSDDVTLDLSGFVFANITPGLGAVRGINVPAPQKSLSVRNGTLRGWSGGGVRAENVRNGLVEKLRLSDNTGGIGVHVGLGSMIRDCTANANETGFQTADRCQVTNCIATENTGLGFNCASYVTLMDCTSSRNGGDGIVTGGGCSIIRCSSTRNIPAGRGIFTGGGCNITACTATANGSVGIRTGQNCTINGCVAGANGSHGIQAGDEGLPGSSVSDCTAHDNGDNGIAAYLGSIANCTANSNAHDGLYAVGGSVAGSSANYNGSIGIDADGVSSSTASYNALGIRAQNGTVNACRAAYNASYGIFAPFGAITASSVTYNSDSGIYVNSGSATNCTASFNGNDGIYADNGVVAHCRAYGNNTSNTGHTDISASSAVRTGNNPTP